MKGGENLIGAEEMISVCEKAWVGAGCLAWRFSYSENTVFVLAQLNVLRCKATCLKEIVCVCMRV